MSLPLHITALVLLAAVLHATWNAVIKTGEDRALTFGAMAHVSALRETSVVFAVLIGWIMLGEPFGGRRVAASVMVVAGIAIMNLAG